MKQLIFSVALWSLAIKAGAQGYVNQVAQFRERYVHELVTDERAPVKRNDIKHLRFFDADSNYRITATFTRLPGSTPMLVPTHSGKQKPFVLYGLLSFSIHDTACSLHIYQPIDIVSGKAVSGHLFLPFNDLTNYESTYGGGRYIDLNTSDIHDGVLELDFNKCYNPYCAYGEGFSCPIPPDENHLKVSIPVGEKLYAKNN